MPRLRLADEPDPEGRFRALYEKHYGQVLGYVLRRSPAGSAGDVVAEVFLVAWRRLEEMPEEPLPWLLGVARKALANERRGGRRRAALLDVLRETAGAELEWEPPDGALFAAFTWAFERLGEADRELLRLVAWEGLTTREASRALGISHAACRVRLHRARRRLARDLEQPSAPPRFEVREEIR